MYRFFPIPGTQRRAVADRVVETAILQRGYVANPNRSQPYGPDGLPWDGAFVDFCLRRAGVRGPGVPSHARTASALQWYIRNRRAHRDPKLGDIVFFPSRGQMQPTVGIVTETDRWTTHGEFMSVDGETDDGMPLSRTSGMADGVYEKRHYETDAIIFGRPDFGARPPKQPESPVISQPVRPSHFVHGKSHRSVEKVQLALRHTVGLSDAAVRGKFDSVTMSAYRYWQRTVGVADTGQPDLESLDALRLASHALDWTVTV